MNIEELAGLSREERIAYTQERFEEFRATLESKRPRYPHELQRLACALVVNDEITPWKASQYTGVSPITLQAWVASHGTPEVREIRVVSETELLAQQNISANSVPKRIAANEVQRTSSSVVLEMRNGSRLILQGNYAERVLGYALSEVMKDA